MKNTCILLCAAAFAAVGCSRLPAADPSGEEAVLTVNLSGLPESKATAGTDAENAVNSLSLYVFDAVEPTMPPKPCMPNASNESS